MADKIVVLNEGRIEQVGSPLKLYREPANLFVAGFIGTFKKFPPRQKPAKFNVDDIMAKRRGLAQPWTLYRHGDCSSRSVVGRSIRIEIAYFEVVELAC